MNDLPRQADVVFVGAPTWPAPAVNGTSGLAAARALIGARAGSRAAA